MDSDSSEEAASSTDKKTGTTKRAPKMRDMIVDALNNCTDSKGASPAFIRNFILGKYPEANSSHFKTSFKRGFVTCIEKNVLVRTKATEAAEGLKGRVKLATKAKPREKATVPDSSASERSSDPGPSSKAGPKKAKTIATEGTERDPEPGKPPGVQKRRAAGANTKKPAVADTGNKNSTAGKKTASSVATPKAGKGTGLAAKTLKGSGAAAKAEKGNVVEVKAGKRTALAAKRGKANASDDDTFVDVETCSENELPAAERWSEAENSATERRSDTEDSVDQTVRPSESDDSTEEIIQRSESDTVTDTEHRRESENSASENEGTAGEDEPLSTIRMTETKRGPGRQVASKKPSGPKKTAKSNTAFHEDFPGTGDPDASASSTLVVSNISVASSASGPTGDSLENDVEPKAKKQRPKPSRRAKN